MEETEAKKSLSSQRAWAVGGETVSPRARCCGPSMQCRVLRVLEGALGGNNRCLWEHNVQGH